VPGVRERVEVGVLVGPDVLGVPAFAVAVGEAVPGVFVAPTSCVAVGVLVGNGGVKSRGVRVGRIVAVGRSVAVGRGVRWAGAGTARSTVRPTPAQNAA
jgi:hypothetical protein